MTKTTHEELTDLSDAMHLLHTHFKGELEVADQRAADAVILGANLTWESGLRLATTQAEARFWARMTSSHLRTVEDITDCLGRILNRTRMTLRGSNEMSNAIDQIHDDTNKRLISKVCEMVHFHTGSDIKAAVLLEGGF